MSSKPKLRKFGNRWVCEGAGHSAIEGTPREAYDTWRVLEGAEVCQWMEGPAPAPGLQKILRRLYGSDGK